MKKITSYFYGDGYMRLDFIKYKKVSFHSFEKKPVDLPAKLTGILGYRIEWLNKNKKRWNSTNL